MTRNDPPNKLEWSICPPSRVNLAQRDWGITWALKSYIVLIPGYTWDSYHFMLPLLLQMPTLEAQLMKIFAKMCKIMYFSEYKFLFQFCIERANSLMGRNCFLYVNSRV